MVCTFFGHKDAPESIKEKLEFEINSLIQSGIKSFLVGNNGYFDYLVQDLLKYISKDQNNIHYNIVLSKINEQAVSGCQHSTVFPEGLEFAHPKYAICKRNDWLIKNSNIAIVYVTNSYSNCYKWAKKALSNGLKVINLADMLI